MLIPQRLQALPSHVSQCGNLAIPADALSDAFGTDHPIRHAVGRIPVLRATSTHVGVGRLNAQMSLRTFVVLDCRSCNGTPSDCETAQGCGSENVQTLKSLHVQARSNFSQAGRNAGS
jgi:hypothetical protein